MRQDHCRLEATGAAAAHTASGGSSIGGGLSACLQKSGSQVLDDEAFQAPG
jgi:hypothetical protein